MPKKRYYLYFIFIIISMGDVFSQRIDSTRFDMIKGYYQEHFGNPANPVILLQADTLLEMARKYNDTLHVKLALAAKLDHYYYGGGHTDSIIAWVNRMKQYTWSIDDKEVYYFVWSARLVNHYIKLGEYNIALAEAEKMLKEAEKDQSLSSIAQCYSTLANIYSGKGLTQKSQEFMFKEIELFERYDLKRYNITFQYSDAAKIYIDLGEPEKAPELLEKAVKQAKTPYHLVTAKLAYVSLYLAQNQTAKAKEMLDECRKIFAENSIQRHYHYLQGVEVDYYRHKKDYHAALRVLELRTKELEKNGDLVSVINLGKTKADILWNMNRKEEAAALYRRYLAEQEKEKERSEEITTSEFATLLNLQQVSTEKRELEKLSQENQLQNIRVIVISLTGLLCVVVFFFCWQRRLNIKLKKSRDKLDEKNQILIKAEEELRIAKDSAEQSNWMKTIFIRNMSHEIRTPLNSIVGFSAILADLLSENEGIEQYASLIEENSHLLLKLVGDILDISALDDNNLKFKKLPTDINKCCMAAIGATKQLFHKDVTLDYKPSSRNLIIHSNPERVTQVLENLLNNSAKFTRRGHVVLAYEVNEKKKQIVFTITDTGIGIPPDQQERVFEQFVKLDDFTQGTGLGLPICRIIAKKLGGNLVLDKTYTQGTGFIFTIGL